MLKNYFKIALRTILKQKEYSIINILGLSIGLACCLLIILFVQDEYSYDNFHEKGDQIYRMSLERKYPDHSTYYALVPHSFSEVLQNDFPEVEATCRITANNGNVYFRYDDPNGDRKLFKEKRLIFVDSNFFNFFSVKLIKGDPDRVLSEPNTLVITETYAKKYFGNEDPINKILQTDFGELKVTGICQDAPENSHFKFDFLGSWNSLPIAENLNYIAFSACIYLQLNEEADPITLEGKLPKMVETYAAAQIEERLQISFKDYTEAGNGYRYFLQPLKDIHLKSQLEAEIEPNGNIAYIYVFVSIAIFILIIAGINFMNLATAKSAERAKEVGVRKVMGSERKQLIYQFLVESILISIISLICALTIVVVAIPYFNEVFEKNINLDPVSNSVTILGSVFFALIIGLLAGLYPAFVLSSFNPVVVLKGKLKGNNKGIWLRNSLVIFQFFISIVLIAGIMVVYNQMNYMSSKNLGYDKDHIIIIDKPVDPEQSWETFDKEILNLPNITGIAHTSAMPGAPDALFFGIPFQPQGVSDVLTTKAMIIDDSFKELLAIEVIEGRGFSEDIDDSLSILLNETAAKTLNIENPIGTRLVSKNNQGGADITYTIVGIVKDFHFQSLRDNISPLAILNPGLNNPINFGYIAIKVRPEDIPQTISSIENKWGQLVENHPFYYSFFDENLIANYRSEENSGKILSVFTLLAIIIACIGLFGLAAFTSQQRTKEIGVRKVLGASVVSVVVLLSKEFTKLVLIAFVFAIPAAWYFIDKWLQNFAYSIDIHIGVFIIAGIIALAIAWFTVGYQALKAAIVNPVKSLQSE